jgi:hypothetical protein
MVEPRALWKATLKSKNNALKAKRSAWGNIVFLVLSYITIGFCFVDEIGWKILSILLVMAEIRNGSTF